MKMCVEVETWKERESMKVRKIEIARFGDRWIDKRERERGNLEHREKKSE